MDKLRILVADDSKMMLSAYQKILQTQNNLEVVALASDGEEAVKQAEATQPDVVILDIKMPKVNGLEAAREILANSPSTGIVIISAYDDTQYFVELLKYGSKGKAYILKSSMDDLDILLDAVEGVARGETILDPRLRERLPQTVLDQLESL